jgi:hypothetical protein
MYLGEKIVQILVLNNLIKLAKNIDTPAGPDMQT